MNLSTKFCSFVALGLLGVLVPSTASATLVKVALKRDGGLVHANGAKSDTNLHADFQALGATDVQTTTVNDTFLWDAGNAAWSDAGIRPNLSGNPDRSFLVKYDFSSLTGFSGADIIKAELRVWMSGGNNDPAGLSNGSISTHDWAEGDKNFAFPGSTPGASVHHPSGTNTSVNQDSSGGTAGNFSTWGASADSDFSFAGDVTATPSATRSSTGGTQWFVYDLKDTVQAWADGTSNYGFAAALGNNLFHASESGTTFEPVLFVEYDFTAVPEPSSFLMLSALALGFGMIRKRS